MMVVQICALSKDQDDQAAERHFRRKVPVGRRKIVSRCAMAKLSMTKQSAMLHKSIPTMHEHRFDDSR